MNKLVILKVKSNKELMSFIDLPHILYKNEPHYVPALNISIKWMLSSKNPFLKHSQIALFIAKDNDDIKGRIVAIYNRSHLDIYNDNTGFFGFFECVNNSKIAKKLFQTAEAWLKNLGIKKIMGPTNLTTNDSCGFLINCFNIDPMVNMPYNFNYYSDLCERSGYKPLIDLSSYNVSGEKIFEKYKKVYQRSLMNIESKNIQIRSLTKKSFDKDVDKLKYVYNEVNKTNWGFLPLNIQEFREMAKDLRRVTPLDLALVAEIEKEIIGFIIAVPNMNQSLKYVKDGKLFPFGLAKFLWHKRKINTARIMILGILPDYRKSGLNIVLYQKIKEALNNRNIFNAEACYIFDENKQMNSILSKISEGISKKYRIYEKII